MQPVSVMVSEAKHLGMREGLVSWRSFAALRMTMAQWFRANSPFPGA